MDLHHHTADKASLYINRELSWIRFNHHVLDGAEYGRWPNQARARILAARFRREDSR